MWASDDRRIDRGSLKPGDHVYSWRTAYTYAHHGIYIGDDKVIHFTRRGNKVGTGTGTGLSSSSRTQIPCTTCTPPEVYHGVELSCLNCFLSGGFPCRFEYSVNPVYFLAQARGGTCTLAASDPAEIVVGRAKYLLENGFGRYDLFSNNCEDFAIYCKTGLLAIDQGGAIEGLGGQVASIRAPALAIPAITVCLNTGNMFGLAASVFRYCHNRYAADIGSGMRKDLVKISAEDLTRRFK